MLSYYATSQVVPRPYGPIEADTLTLKWIEMDAIVAAIVLTMFALLYAITLAALQRISGYRNLSRRAMLSITLCATLVQVIATFCTDAFTRSRFGWNLPPNISLPISIVGSSLPGLMVAVTLLIRWGRNSAMAEC